MRKQAHEKQKPLGASECATAGLLAVWPFGRLAVSALCCGGLLMVCPSAHAQTQGGEWELALEVEAPMQGYILGNGTMETSVHNLADSGARQMVYSTQGAQWNGATGGYGWQGETMTIKGDITYFLRLRWKPSYYDPGPPPEKGVLILNSQSTVDGNATGAMNFQVTDASGRATPPSDRIASTDENGQPCDRLLIEAGGKRLFSFDNPDQETDLRLGPLKSKFDTSAVSPKVEGRGVYQAQSRISNLQGYMEIKLDDRTVMLSRGGRYEYSKLEGGEWHTYGDSIYSAKNADPDKWGSLKIPLSINAGLSGSNWKTRFGGAYDISPSWSAQGFEMKLGENDTQYWGLTQYGSPLIRAVPSPNFRLGDVYQGTPTGAKEFVTTYTATDNDDGATATGYYHLTLHDPIEPSGTTFSGFTVKRAFTEAAPYYWWSDVSGSDEERPKITSGTSTEVGYELKATTELKGFEGLLGLSASASHTSKYTFAVEQKVTVPVIGAGQVRYLIVKHPFSRTHARFFKYDALGKIKRIANSDALGYSYDPPIETYHEAIWDEPGGASWEWSAPKPYDGFDPNNLPSESAPPVGYDYSGGSS